MITVLVPVHLTLEHDMYWDFNLNGDPIFSKIRKI